MKFFLLFLITLNSISSFAETDCTYFAKEVGHAIENSLSQKAYRVIENKMKKKGYKRVFEVDDAVYTLKFSADWWRGAVHNGLNHEVCGDALATVKLTSNIDKRVKAESRYEGVSGILCSIGRDAKAILLLKRALKVIPICAEL
jgi:hypothetical protein